MLSFGLGALALCIVVTSTAYFAVRRATLNQFVQSAVTRAEANATLFGQNLNKGENVYAIEGLIAPIDAAAGQDTSTCPLATSVLNAGGDWVPDDTYLFLTPEGSPNTEKALSAYGVTKAVSAGKAAEQIVQFPPCGAYILVGYAVPTPGGPNAGYFALISTQPVSHTLHLLLAALALASAVTVFAGMILGRWGADRVLRPLRSIAEVASAIADGRLDSRIEAQGSGDLAVLSSSFNQMVDRLQQRIEHDARFASDVSHELRSPLTTLATSLSVIESRREELPERAQQALDLLSAEVHRFQAMVRDLLEISRLDAGSVDFQMSLVEVGELVENALAASAADHVPLEIDPLVGQRKITADKRRVERVMTNLVDNAARHGGGAVRVSVEYAGTAEADFVRIAVEDEGPGVPEGERSRIFERFARGTVAAGRRGRGGGSGLGLALVAEHVRLHGGRVWVEDRAGGGARFVVEVPLTAPGAGEEEEEEQ